MSENSKKKVLFYFTLFYPFTHNKVLYDAYVLSEVEQFAHNFDSVVVISMSIGHDGQVEVAPNVSVHNLQLDLTTADKFSLLRIIGRSFFIDELINLKKIYNRKITLPLFKAMAAYAVKAAKAQTFLEKLLKQVDFSKYQAFVYTYWNFEYALGAVLLKHKYPIKTIVRTHSLDLYFERVPENYLPFRRYVYNNCNLFVFISLQGQQYFFSKHKIDPVLQQKSIINLIGSRNTLPAYKADFSRIVILSNAWIQPLKRIDLIVKSLALIRDINIEWIHVGDDYGTGRFPALKSLADQYLSNKSNISYEFAGRVTREELLELYVTRKVNVLINLSTTEGTPVSMMEAISFGVPVIGTNVGGVPEIIQDGLNGFLLPANISAQDVADKIRQWFQLPAAKKEELSSNARKVWQRKFNADINGAELMSTIAAL